MEEKNRIQIEMANEVLKGTYANSMTVTHTGGEFILDFMTIFPPKGILGARIFVSPNHAKRILKALGNSIQRYEAKFGKIEEAEEPTLQ